MACKLLRLRNTCKAFHVSRKKDPMRHQYFLDKTLLPSVNHHKDLMVWLELRLGELKWDSSERRHKYLCLVKMYKILFGYRDADASKF